MAVRRVRAESGVRKHLRRSPTQRLVQWWTCRLLAEAGEGLFVERNVRFLRYPENIHLGAQVIVKEGARICSAQPDATIAIGPWTTIGQHTFIFASAGITIGADCLIAPFCYVVDSNHGVLKGRLIREQLMISYPITIEDDVWLGCGTRVLRGVTIHRGAVVGAGSVVMEDIPEYAIAQGVPAKVVGERI